MMKFLPILLLATVANAGYEQAPPSFTYKSDKAVFIDITEADYDIVYDVQNKTAMVETILKFEAKEEGFPVFDLVAQPLAASLNGVAIKTPTIADPFATSTLRVMDAKISVGTHELKIRHQLSANVVFNENGVGSGFWMSDLTDRRYLEQYLPTNLEYDQYAMTINVKIENAAGMPHVLKANGAVTEMGENQFEVKFPEFYTASLMYFHLLPVKSLPPNVQFYYKSIDGRMLPVDIYTSYGVDNFVASTKTILAELENDYGPFPHEKVVIYGNAPSGGMEHAGATATSLSALGHELFHCYHARGLSPANGNAGWMDEAIARHRDNRYPLIQGLTYQSTRLAGRNAYTRATDRMAYTEGAAFLGWIAYRMNAQGLSFKAFLRDYFEKYKFTTVTTELFQRELSLAARMDLTPEFNQYIYGRTSSHKMKHDHHAEADEFHPVLTTEQLKALSLPQ